MTNQINCCINNLQRFQYGATLHELVNEGNQVKVELCQSYCVGCRDKPYLLINGKFSSADSIMELKSLVIK